MGHLANLFLALIAVAIADQVGPLTTPRPEFAPLLIFAPYLFVPLLRKAVGAHDYPRANRLANRLRRLPVAAQLIADLLLGYGSTLEAARGASELPPGWPTPWELVRFLPFVFVTVTSLDASARAHADTEHGRRWFAFQLRSFFGACVPFIVLIAADSLLALTPSLAWSIHTVDLYSSLHSLLLLLGLSAAVPWLLRHAWAAEPLPVGGVRDLVELVAQRAQFRCREVLLWRTGRSMANAMIVGVLPSTRRIFFSDSLLEALPPRELAAVTAHEIGHAKRGHMAQFLMLALGGFGCLSMLAHEWNPDWPVPFELGALGLVVLGVLIFRSLSRRFELEADLHACELTGDPRAIGDALMRLGGRLRDVAGWRHFAPSARDAFLQRASEDPAFLSLFRSRMRMARIAIVLFFVVGFGGSFVSKFDDYAADRYRLALWRAQYATAVEYSQFVASGADEQRVLRFVADRLGDGTGESRLERAQAVTELALELFHDPTRFGAALWILHAAEAAGDPEAAQVARAIESLQAGRFEALATLPEHWRSVIDATRDVNPPRDAGTR